MVASEACLVVLREMPIAMRVVAMLGVLVWQQIGTFLQNVPICSTRKRMRQCEQARFAQTCEIRTRNASWSK